jgi:hypothetical protein
MPDLSVNVNRNDLWFQSPALGCRWLTAEQGACSLHSIQCEKILRVRN